MSDMDKILELSLDDYIALKKQAHMSDVDGGSRPNATNDTASNAALKNQYESKFKAERRITKREEEADEDDCDMLDMSADIRFMTDQQVHQNDKFSGKTNDIWRGPSAETNYLDLDCMRDECDSIFNDLEVEVKTDSKQVPKSLSTIDLRTRIGNKNSNSNSNSNKICRNIENQLQEANTRNKNTKNLQWRPTCQDIKTQQHQPQQGQQQELQHSISLGNINANERNWQRRRRNNRNGYHKRNGWGGGNSNKSNGNCQNWNWNNRNYNNDGNGGNLLNLNNNNGRIQRPNQRNNQDMINKNIKAVLERINSNNAHVNRQNGMMHNTTITIPTKEQQLCTQTQADVKALLGVNDNSLKTEAIPMLAAKFLDFLQNGAKETVHKPLYDMRIQKQIHGLQGKPLTYKCPSGEVVSSDGVGIENCEITPSASGVTLNYRFG